MSKKVVVTAMGAVSPIGSDLKTIWHNVSSGNSGITKVNDEFTYDTSSKICGYVKDIGSFEVDKQLKRCDPFIQYAVWSAEQCLQTINTEQLDPARSGVVIGSGIGGLHNIELNYQRALVNPKKISPFFLPCSLSNMAAGLVSMRYQLKGPSLCISTACASGVHAIIVAAQMISAGVADFMIAGGAEKASDLLGIGGFSSMRALSTRNDEPTKASRPWDQNRDGFVLSDGAAIIAIESEEHAIHRGATIIAEIAGYGMTSDAFHITQPDPEGEGGKRAMELAIQHAKIDKSEIGYINAHATSTPLGDKIEPNAIKACFKDYSKSLLVSSTKSTHGHLLGAAGAFESIITIQSLQHQIAPPTINLDNPDPDIDLNLVPNEAQQLNTEYALCNSFGFGGTNASIIFKKSIS